MELLGLLPQSATVPVSLLLTLATAGLMLRPPRRGRLVMLGVLAAVAVVNYLHFFDFHGRRVFVHHHEVAHYYLGSKYFEELGYTGLYAAMLRAEVEPGPGVELARNLETNEIEAATTVRERGAAVEARFGPERWEQFAREATFLRRAMGPRFQGFLLDHGFNPTPVWTLLGGTVANLLPADSEGGLLLLGLLDVLLLAILFAALGRAFGGETALLALIFFCCLFGAGFDWIGGAFLRHPWLAALIVGVCCLERRRHATAGALIAVAATLRLFPAVFIAGIAAKVAADLVSRRPVERGHLRFLVAFGGTAAALVAATGLAPGGFASWGLFVDNLKTYVATAATNGVGLKAALATPLGHFLAGGALDTALDVAAATAVFLALALVFLLARRCDDIGVTALGSAVLFAALTVGAYYQVFLILLIVAHRRQPRALALMFAVESATALLLFFVDAQAAIYVFRSLLLLFLFGALYLDAGERAVRELIARVRPPQPAAAGSQT